MKIGAIIMAGGEGVRLRPMTLHCPKPLVPLLGKPVMAYTLQLLKKHGINGAGVTLWYQPKAIRAAFRDGEKMGMKLRYFEETSPMGTAGSVGMARKWIGDTFFVLSGDGLTDCDLTEAMRFHKQKKALATLVLKRVEVPLQYGAVMTDKEGKIVRFVEKPDWSRAFTNLVNTGIYILEPEIFDYIPEDEMKDFGKDIFPMMLDKGLALYGWEMQGYWCDVGSQEAYLQAQQDLLNGKVGLDAEKGVHPQAMLQTDVHLQGNFFIDRDAVIEKGAAIRNSVIGPGCRIGTGAVIENSCLWQQAKVGSKARIDGSVLCQGTRVMGGAVLENGCTVGQNAIVGAHVKMHTGVKIWPQIRVTSGAVLRESWQKQGMFQSRWEDETALCDTPETACRMVQAYSAAVGCRKIITAHMDAGALQTIVAGTLAYTGCQVLMGDFATLPMLQESMRIMGADGGILVTPDGMILLDKAALPVSEAIRRKIDGLMLNGGKEGNEASGRISHLAGLEEMYVSNLVKEYSREKLLQPVAVFCQNEQLLKTVEKMLKSMGTAKVRVGKGGLTALRQGEIGFELSEDGRRAVCIEEQGKVEDVQLQLLRLLRMHEKQGRLYDLPDVPRVLSGLYQLCDEDERENGCALQRIRMGDGLHAIADVCEMIKHAPLSVWLSHLPGTHVICREVACQEGDKGRILYALCQRAALPYTLSRGMQVHHESGYATIVPHQSRPSVRITGEAATMEAAGELCDFYDREIRRALETKQKSD